MPFVERREGEVVGVYANAQPGYAEEFLPEETKEVKDYRASIFNGQPEHAGELPQ
jgi:hypothetical protein